MYTSVNAFVSDWSEETLSTVKVFSALNDDLMEKKFGENVRTMKDLAWHITSSLPEMMSACGLFEHNYSEGQEVPVTVKGILSFYAGWSTMLIEGIREKWTDESLDETVNMYGEDWKKSFVLQVLIRHEIHHRAQLTTLMRIAGLTVPGVYGPNYEEMQKFMGLQ